MLVGKHVLGVEIRRRHVVATALLLAGLGLALAGMMLPGAGLRWGLVKALRGLGMVEVSVSDADLSLFGGRVVVRKMVARPASGAALGIKDFSLRFRWGPLLDKRVALDRVALEGVDIDVRREGGSVVINGLPLLVAPPPPASGPAEAATPWAFEVAALELTDSRLRLADGDTVIDVAVERLLVENLNSRDPATPLLVRLKGTLNGAPVSASGSLTPFAAHPGFDLKLEMEGLDLAQVKVSAQRLGLAGLGGRLGLALAVKGALGGGGPAVEASGSLTLANTRLAAPAVFSAAHLGLDLRRAHWDGHRLEMAATLQAKTLAGSTPEGGATATALAVTATRLVWDGGLTWDGGLSLEGAKISAAGLDAQPDALVWSGSLSLNQGAGRAEGKLDLGPLRLTHGSHGFVHRHAGAEGWLEFGGRGTLPLTAKLKLAAEGIGLRDTVTGQDLLALERAEASELSLADSGAISAGRIAAETLTALRQEGKGGYPWRLEARRVKIEHPALTAEGDVSAAEVRIEGLLARLTRTKDGFVGLEAGKNKGAKTPEPDAETPAMALGRLVVTGDSRVMFEDRSLPEMVRLDVRGIDLSTSDLDTEKPDRDSPFDLKATVSGATIAASGMLHPFADAFSGRVEGRIKSFELPPLSPYMADSLGIALKTGHFDGTLRGTVVKGALDGKMEVVLSNLFIAQPDANAVITKQVNMPIETVLDLLRDGEDRIQLSLPIRGNMENPDFDISDAVAQAVAGALKSTVLTTLKVAFPVVTLFNLVLDADDRARLALAPLVFPVGGPWLTDEHRKTLASVAELMRARPGLRLNLCGKANAADWPGVAERKRAEDKPILSRLEHLVGGQKEAAAFGPPDRQALIDLADHRATMAREFMADHTGTEASRLFSCRSEVEEPGGKGGRVELLL
ncbi:conserved hypothetical protein [Candidatus Terasakiella magnetica]|nr:conserved hypothetical protein [Candidatus Terasakiella magnetica]